MGIDGCKSSRSNQGIAVSVWDMDVCLWISVTLCKAEIDDMDGKLVQANSYQNIVGLQVSVNNMTSVDLLNARNLFQLSQYIRQTERIDVPIFLQLLQQPGAWKKACYGRKDCPEMVRAN